jgi:hypothetical protein
MHSSKKAIAQKLGIKEGHRVALLHAPKGYTSILASVPDEVTITTRLAGEPFHVVQAFFEDDRALRSEIKKLSKAIYSFGSVWICWRKGNVTSLNRDLIHKRAEVVGLEGVASCSIDESWSALRLMRPKNCRGA